MQGSNDDSIDNQSVWPTESNEQYNYKKVVTTKPVKNMFGYGTQVDKSEDIKVSYHSFNTGLTRTKTTIEPMDNDQILTTTETWTTAHPSYATLSNGAILAAIAAAGAIGMIFKDDIGFLKFLINSPKALDALKQSRDESELEQHLTNLKDIYDVPFQRHIFVGTEKMKRFFTGMNGVLSK